MLIRFTPEADAELSCLCLPRLGRHWIARTLNRCGFAAGCEARLRLAVPQLQAIGLRPSYGLWPKCRAEPEPGA